MRITSKPEKLKLIYPSVWENVKIGDILELYYGKSQKGVEDKNGKYPIIGTSGIVGRTNESLFNGPSIIIGRKGTIDSPIFIDIPFWVIDTAFFSVIFNGFDPKFLYYKLSMVDWLKYNEASGVPSLSANTIKNINLNLPPLPEQRVIAEVLSDVDALIEAQAALIKKKRLIKQGVMQELLTGKRRLPGFRGEWRKASLNELEKQNIITLSRGNVISKNDIKNIPGHYPIYSSSIMNDGLFGKYGNYMFDEDLITWSVDGGGHFFYRPKHKFSVTNVSGIMKIEDKSIFDCKFLSYQLKLLHSKLVFDYTRKAHPSVIRELYEVSIPNLAEQVEISKIISDLDSEINLLIDSNEKTIMIKQGMMQELLTGRTRLV